MLHQRHVDVESSRAAERVASGGADLTGSREGVVSKKSQRADGTAHAELERVKVIAPVVAAQPHLVELWEVANVIRRDTGAGIAPEVGCAAVQRVGSRSGKTIPEGSGRHSCH